VTACLVCGHLAELHTQAGTCTRWVTLPNGVINGCPCRSGLVEQETLW
jgi:hypothetical protein